MHRAMLFNLIIRKRINARNKIIFMERDKQKIFFCA